MTQLAQELDLANQCRAAVARLHERHGWSLLDRSRWIETALTHLAQGITDKPDRAAFYSYSEALYRACSGQEGQQRQEQGYSELGHFLFQFASRRYAEFSADATQLALLQTFRCFSQCGQPGWFIAFAIYKVRDAVKTIRQHEQHYQALRGQSLEQSALPEELPDLQQHDVSARLISAEDRELLECYRADFLRRRPRASRQLSAVWLKYVDGLSDTEISQRLGVRVDDVYTLRSRGLKQLQQDPGWRALAAEFGIAAELP